MQLADPLKPASIAFAVLWTGWMIWTTGSFDLAGVIITVFCGALAGIAWYFAMRWIFRHIRLSPRDGR